MKINVASLGCRLNQSEIQSVITVLKDRGHEITLRDDADVFIINSCKVTQHSERKTRKLIYRAERASRKTSQAMIIVTGCCAQNPYRKGKLYFVPNDYKYLIPDLIDNTVEISEISNYDPGRFNYLVPVKATTTRINLKIQDGCDNFCSYCIIPYVRGLPQSKPAQQVISEFKNLLQGGYKEIVLTGVMIGKYCDEKVDLAALVEQLLNTKGEFRLHLASLSPAHITDRLIELLGHRKTVRHINLSLQSGSNKILQKMNRPYSQQDYLRLVKKIRAIDDNFNLTSDVIVGFPGESDEDFFETLAVVREAAFSHIHTFRYSPRPGTSAAGFTDDVPEEIKQQRSKKVIDLYEEQKKTYYKKFHGASGVLLSERSHQDRTRGFNEYYIPVLMDTRLERNRFYTIQTFFTHNDTRMEGKLLT